MCVVVIFHGDMAMECFFFLTNQLDMIFVCIKERGYPNSYLFQCGNHWIDRMGKIAFSDEHGCWLLESLWNERNLVFWVIVLDANVVFSHPDFFFPRTAELPRHHPAPERTGYAGPVWFPCYHPPKVPAVEPEFLGTLENPR